MAAIKIWATCLALLLSVTSFAGANADDQNGRLRISKEQGAELQLWVRQLPLANVIDDIAGKTGVQIHYTVMPYDKVTATCAGSTVKLILECLLVGKADLVFRFSQQVSRVNGSQQLEEAWVVTPQPHSGMKGLLVSTSSEVQKNEVTKPESLNQWGMPDQTDALLKKAESLIAAERVEAMGGLLAGGRKGDPAVKQMLLAGVKDDDPMVRVRALSSLAHREGAGASATLHDAMQDNDKAVRITAVDNAGDDVSILQQALTDSDPTVRELAKVRINRIEKKDVTFDVIENTDVHF
jgi:hypothetical protein